MSELSNDSKNQDHEIKISVNINLCELTQIQWVLLVQLSE